MTSTLTIDEPLREALGTALDLAYDDQKSYIDYASPDIDYGDEWPEVCAEKCKKFRALGEFGESIGFAGERERWESLAKEFEETLENDNAEAEV